MHHELPLGFIYDTEVWRKGQLVSEQRTVNLIPQVGIDYLANVIRGSATVIPTWHVGIFEGNFVPAGATTAADLPSNAQESVAYVASARPTWAGVYDGTSIVTNEASRAAFVMTADKTIFGGFLIASPTKGGNTGTLFSMSRFSTAEELKADDEFRITIGIGIVPTSIF